MWDILVASLLSGMSAPIGAWLSLQFKRITDKVLAFFLGLAGGIMLTVILTELYPTSLRAGSQRLFWLGTGCGWIFMWLMGYLMDRWTYPAMMGHGPQATPANVTENDNFVRIGWFIAMALAIHDLPEGLAIGAADAVHPHVGLLLALVIALHNIPEGMSIALPLYLGGISKHKVLWITFLIGWVTPLGTLIALGLVQIFSVFIALSLAFSCGSMAFVVAKEILPQAFQANPWSSGYGLLIGSLIMTLASFAHP